MPYIALAARLALDSGLRTAKTPGELNYVLTATMRNYFEHSGANYQAINDVLGALEGAKLEFARRAVAPYEDEKILENGDIYT